MNYGRNAKGRLKRVLVIAMGMVLMAVWTHQMVDFRSLMHRIYRQFSTKQHVSRL